MNAALPSNDAFRLIFNRGLRTIRLGCIGIGVLGVVAIICLRNRSFGFTVEMHSAWIVRLVVCLDGLVEGSLLRIGLYLLV